MREISRSARWLVLPLAVLLLALVGLALSADPAPETNNSQNQQTELEERSLGEEATASDDDEAGPDTAESPSVTISTGEGEGEVEVRFDSDGVARVSTEGQEGEFDLVPGTESGLRITDDGQLEPVPPGQIGPTDLGLTPSDDGVDLQAPGNNLVELRPDGAAGGVSATEFDGENANPLTPENGIVELADGSTVSPIEPASEGFTTVSPRGPLPWRWIFTAIAVIAFVSALTGFLMHRSHHEHDLRVHSAPTTARVDENFEQFVDRLESDPDPTRAIRLGFHAAEQGLGGLPIRLENETPFEWHQRVSNTIPSANEPLRKICDLFAKARFAPGDATDDDRHQMISELRSMLTDVHPPAPSEATMAGNSTSTVSKDGIGHSAPGETGVASL